MAWGRPGVLALELCKPGMAHSCSQEVEAEDQKSKRQSARRVCTLVVNKPSSVRWMRGCREGGHRRFKSYLLIEEYFSHSVNTVCYAHLWG